MTSWQTDCEHCLLCGSTRTLCLMLGSNHFNNIHDSFSHKCFISNSLVVLTLIQQGRVFNGNNYYANCDKTLYLVCKKKLQEMIINYAFLQETSCEKMNFEGVYFSNGWVDSAQLNME